jgi:hypothetical protein
VAAAGDSHTVVHLPSRIGASLRPADSNDLPDVPGRGAPVASAIPGITEYVGARPNAPHRYLHRCRGAASNRANAS